MISSKTANTKRQYMSNSDLALQIAILKCEYKTFNSCDQGCGN